MYSGTLNGVSYEATTVPLYFDASLLPTPVPRVTLSSLRQVGGLSIKSDFAIILAQKIEGLLTVHQEPYKPA